MNYSLTSFLSCRSRLIFKEALFTITGNELIEVIQMATKSFYEDMVIDTPEAAARLTELFEENRPFVIKGPVPKDANDEFILTSPHGY